MEADRPTRGQSPLAPSAHPIDDLIRGFAPPAVASAHAGAYAYDLPPDAGHPTPLCGDIALARTIPGPYEESEMRHFLDTFLYREEAFFVDEVVSMDADSRAMVAVLDTTRPLPLSAAQRVDATHPAHVSAAEMLMATGSLGCMHAWFFHGCRWDEGWAGFGNRIHRADWKKIATIGPPMRLESRETKTRVGKARVVIRYAFDFWQGDDLVYQGDQTAMFFKGKVL